MCNECRLTDATGLIVAVGTRDQMISSLKRLSPDGEYAVVGPGIDAKFYKVGGVVHPAGGDVDSQTHHARTRDECVAAFGLAAMWNNVEYMEAVDAFRRSAVRKAILYDRLRATGISQVNMFYHHGYEVDGWVEYSLEIDALSPNGMVVELPPDLLDTLEECFSDRLPDGWELGEGSYGVIDFNVASGTVNYTHSEEWVSA